LGKKHEHYSSRFPDVEFKRYTVSESLKGHLYIFKTATGMFSFERIDLGTQILIRHMTIPQKPSTLLDLGSGYGPIGIVLGYESPESTIYFIEINERALWALKENIKVNLPQSGDRIEVLSGDYFEPLQDQDIKFDAIYMNPPIREGRDQFLEVLSASREFLKPNGFFEFVIRKKLGASYIYDYFKEKYPNENIDIIAKRSGYWVFHCFH
jgi:16S rRNA G1207 methylase RsmC